MEEKSIIYRFFGHLITITKHKYLVTKYCFKCGLIKQGILHDLSKYSLSEFIPGVKYFCGDKSPITKEKNLIGYSKAWLHHKGRNKHHWEYWVDRLNKKQELTIIEMPFNYVIECVIDKICASKVYKGKNYTQKYPYEFFKNSMEINVMNKKNSKQILKLLKYLKDYGEIKALQYYKELYIEYKQTNITPTI